MMRPAPERHSLPAPSGPSASAADAALLGALPRPADVGALASPACSIRNRFAQSRGSAGPGASAAPRQLGRHFDVGPALDRARRRRRGLGVAWWLAGRFLRPLRAMTTRRAGDLCDQPASTPRPRRARTTSSPSSAGPSTISSAAWRHRSSRSGISWPTPRTSCGRRWPASGPCCRSRSPTRTPTPQTCDRPARRCSQLGGHQERLIDALLTLATSERGCRALGAFDLGEVAGGIVLSHQQDADRQGIQIDATLTETTATGDRASSRACWPT